MRLDPLPLPLTDLEYKFVAEVNWCDLGRIFLTRFWLLPRMSCWAPAAKYCARGPWCTLGDAAGPGGLYGLGVGVLCEANLGPPVVVQAEGRVFGNCPQYLETGRYQYQN